MDRRDFLRVTGAVAAAAAIPGSGAAGEPSAAAAAPPGSAPGVTPGWRTFETTTRAEVAIRSGPTRIWLPLPLTTDTPYQRTLGSLWRADGGTASLWIDPVYGAGAVWAEFPAGSPAVLEVTSRFATRDVAVDLAGPATSSPGGGGDLSRYLAPTDLLPTDGIVRSTSDAIVKGITGDLAKARAIYDWVVDSAHRDPRTRGCGVGDVRFMLENRALSGKCADLNALFVALLRSQGIPARDVYGVRVAPSALGYGSLGKGGGVVTKAQHCRAEFHVKSHGWIPADPADVLKVILEEDGGKPATDPRVVAARRRLFGSWEMNWLAYNFAHDLVLPGSTGGKLGFLMYPQAETGAGRIDCLDPDGFRYAILAREVA